MCSPCCSCAGLKSHFSRDRGPPSARSRITPSRGRPVMRGAVLHAPYDVRTEQLADPKILDPTDAVIRITATCVCGTDMWSYRGTNAVTEPSPIGHEYC